MPELERPDGPLTTNVKWRFPSVHPEGRKYVVIAAAVTAVTYMAINHFIGWLLVGVTIWVGTFFRDPVRTTPSGNKFIVAPADGLITMIAKVPPPPGVAPRVLLGQRAIAGETILGIVGLDIPVTGTSQ